jgi:hypothetical protein
MTDHITLSREQAGEIFKAINGIKRILELMPRQPENMAAVHAFMYGIMSNLAVIQTNLTGTPRVNSN